MPRHDTTVEELVGMIERGELRLPEMQRRFVWKSTRVRDLLDSLYRGYPSGAILLWETDEHVPLQEFAVQQAQNPFRSTRLLLDGQQRLTALSAVLRGEPVKVRGRQRPIELLFNLEHPEDLAVVTEVEEDGDETEKDSQDEDLLPDESEAGEDELQRRFDRMTFVVATRKLAQLPQWVKVSEVFGNNDNLAFLRRAGVTSFDDPRATKYNERLSRLRDIRKYTYRVDVLERGLSYNEVTEIFVRVNSLGAKLRSSDLALAQITAKWRNSLRVFQSFQEDCTKAGFDLDLGLHLRNLVTFATGQSRFLAVGRLSPEQLQTAWAQAREGMNFAMNFLKSNAGIENPVLLSSPFILIALARFGQSKEYRMTPAESQRLRCWILLANAKGRYSRGSSETILDQDLAALGRGDGPEALVERLRSQVGRLDIRPEELEGRNQRSALFKTMFLAFRAAGAKDWRSDLAIDLNHSGRQHRLQFHHIFPKALLRGNVTGREADDIANLAFIAGGTNRRISDKSPAEYIPPLLRERGEQIFVAQAIPTERHLLHLDGYKPFLAERRIRIAAALNTFLGIEPA